MTDCISIILIFFNTVHGNYATINCFHHMPAHPFALKAAKDVSLLVGNGIKSDDATMSLCNHNPKIVSITKTTNKNCKLAFQLAPSLHLRLIVVISYHPLHF